MSDDDNKKRPAANPDWISSLDPLSAVRRAMAADPNVERALRVIESGSLQNIIRKANEL